MPGPTVNNQIFSAVNSTTTTVTTTTETVVCTLSNLNSRGVGYPLAIEGFLTCAVSPLTTLTVARIRQNTLSGAIVGSAANTGGIAGDLTSLSIVVNGIDQPAGEYAGQSYVLTVQATGAGANWNVTFAFLQAVT
jgi:hypothetical protein